MIFIEHAVFNDATIKANLGAPEYSYVFVKKAFRRILQRLGTCVDISDPAHDVDPIFHAARARGEDCIFLSYNPPHQTPLGLACPTVPVFAWEYDTIPFETWNNDPRNDWRYVLSRTGRAITHCQSAAQAVRRSMGQDYPIWVAPAPLFDVFRAAGATTRGWREPFELALPGGLAISAGEVDLSLFRPERTLGDAAQALRLLERAAADPARPPQTLRLEGVIYTSILNPGDGRKNWRDLTAGFVWAFRNTPTATLLLKLARSDLEDGLLVVLQHLSTLGPFACRVVLIQGLLPESSYRALIDATTYAVNTAYGEGQCLPLMEYMSAGRPAVAPAHTAMLDYVSPENSFVIRSEPTLTQWPHDERAAKRCLHHRISFADYVRQCRESYRVARDEPNTYARMSAAAVSALQAFCSEEVVLGRLADMLTRVTVAADAAE
jgi:hypothetical protein